MSCFFAKKSTVEPSYKLNSNMIYRYKLDYCDRDGDYSTRLINVLYLEKSDAVNRWFFEAETPDGRRTFRTERVRCLHNIKTGQKYYGVVAVREYLKKNHMIR